MLKFIVSFRDCAIFCICTRPRKSRILTELPIAAFDKFIERVLPTSDTPKLAAATLFGSADFCLITAEPAERVKAEIEAKGWPVELGVVPRTGARGPIRSVYVRDPDGNLVEIAEEAFSV